ncbi:unnamed protein product [Alopecurus aequalis]
MPNSFSNGGETWSEIREHSNGDSSMAQHLSLQAGELPGSELGADPARTSMMTTQMAWGEDGIMADEIMEDADSGAEQYWALLKHLTGPLPPLQMALAPPKSITLVLDMDETLIHSSMKNEGADFSFPMLNEGKEYTVYVKKRPFVDAFLEKVAEMFHIVVFTASIRPYADQLLDILDPGNRLISQRYYRDSCLRVDNNHLKDLTIIEPDLAKVAIIDNTPEVYKMQVNNGIPIKTWTSDPSDAALPELMPFLQTLSVAEDVRPIIATKFINQR